MHDGQRTRRARKLLVGLFEVVQVEMRIAERMDELPASSPHTWATIIVSRAYEAILKGTPRKVSALRWYIWQERRPPAT